MKFARLPILRVLLARPRLLACMILGCVIGIALPEWWVPDFVTRLLIAWNAAAIVYLILALQMMASSKSQHIRTRANAEDEGRHTVLALVIGSSVLTLFATAFELSAAKDVHGWIKLARVGLASLTVLSTWCVNQTMFALHYAHDYHADKSKRNHGLCFPGDQVPDYFDFLYAASIIGTSGQTADVTFDTSRMRRMALIHSVLSFFFNTIILALTINIAAGML
ncbi:MAG: DUF1345 domain-containing protein [Rudaea sp.]